MVQYLPQTGKTRENNECLYGTHYCLYGTHYFRGPLRHSLFWLTSTALVIFADLYGTRYFRGPLRHSLFGKYSPLLTVTTS